MTGPAQDTDAWNGALIHFAEARAQDPERSPASLIHSAYYAMFHAARAFLLRHEGSAPKKHDRVIRQFGFAIKEAAAELRQAGRHFNEAWDIRIEADYERPGEITPAMTRETLQKATASYRDALSAAALIFGKRQLALTIEGSNQWFSRKHATRSSMR